jgi:hypothetical protein
MQYLNNPQYLSTQETANPFLVIYSFYQEFHLPQVRKLISSWMESANSNKAWKSKSSVNLVYFHEKILPLIEATWLIKQIDTQGRLSILYPDLNKERGKDLELDHYCKPSYQPNAWDYFPRSLSRKQYRNPYKVFTKLFKYATLSEWKKKLNDALHYALETWEDGKADCLNDAITVKKHLDKVADACHLIAVREDEWLRAEAIGTIRKTIEE